jgi:hypothetical protein
MRTCIIQTNNAPDSLIRFTEVGCLFNYKNEWLNYFQNIIITDNADEIKTPGWKINAGQYITTSIRIRYKNDNNIDLRESDLPLLFESQYWNIDKEMKYYRGKKQEYLFRNYMVMILKSRNKMIYFSNNESIIKIKGYKGELWLPASGIMAGRIQYYNPEAKITIYDINPTQLEFSKWLNSQQNYPSKEKVNKHISNLGKISVAEEYNENINDWIPARAKYKCLDIIEQNIKCPIITSNILEYMPVYHKHGFHTVSNWRSKNSKFILTKNNFLKFIDT